MVDRTSKILLAVIALGLWANVMMPLLKPARAEAQDADPLKKISDNLGLITFGICPNIKICGPR